MHKLNSQISNQQLVLNSSPTLTWVVFCPFNSLVSQGFQWAPTTQETHRLLCSKKLATFFSREVANVITQQRCKKYIKIWIKTLKPSGYLLFFTYANAVFQSYSIFHTFLYRFKQNLFTCKCTWFWLLSFVQHQS